MADGVVPTLEAKLQTKGHLSSDQKFCEEARSMRNELVVRLKAYADRETLDLFFRAAEDLRYLNP